MTSSRWCAAPRFHALFVLILMSCISATHAFSQVKIGFMLSDLNTDRWYKDKDFFSEKVKALGGEVINTIADGNPDKQLEQVADLIKQGAKVLVVVPVDGKSAAAIVEQAHKANIKVIAYDRLIQNADLDFYVSYNNNKVGQIMAEYALKEKPSGNFAIINGPESDNNAKQINKGIHAVLDASIQSGKIKMVDEKTTEMWSDMESMILAQDMVQKNKNLDAILTSADILAVGVVRALDDAGLAGKVLVTGQDADLQSCKYIMEGKQQMTIFKPIPPLAAKAAELAMQMANGKACEKNGEIDNGKISVPSFLIDPVLVTKENLKSIVIAGGHWKEEDLVK